MQPQPAFMQDEVGDSRQFRRGWAGGMSNKKPEPEQPEDVPTEPVKNVDEPSHPINMAIEGVVHRA